MLNENSKYSNNSLVEKENNLLNMTATINNSLLERLTEAASDTAFLQPVQGNTTATVNNRLKNETREELTDSSIVKVLEQFNFTSERLQGAMHRIGFLESQVETLQDQARFLPEMRAKAARSIVLERENSELKDVINDRNLQLMNREKLLDNKEEQISMLENIIEAHRKQLNLVEAELERLESNGWIRFWAWFTGMPLAGK
jgi:hypothetical protein